MKTQKRRHQRLKSIIFKCVPYRSSYHLQFTEIELQVNPFLLSQVEFLAKLTEAIAAQSKPAPATTTTTTTPKPKWHKPTSKPKKGSKKGSKKSKKKGKTPKYLKYIPTTTTPAPTEAVPEAPAIDYNALAKALLGN